MIVKGRPTAAMRGDSRIRIPGTSLQLTQPQQAMLLRELNVTSVRGAQGINPDYVVETAVRLFGSR